MTEAHAVILAAFVTAAVALWIGWLQSQALREQNRIAAFDKRLAVFRDAQMALTSVLRRGDADGEAIGAMTRATQASWFLFPDAVSEKLAKMRDQMIDLNSSASMLREPLDGSNRSEHIKLKHTSLKALIDELGTLADLFKPHLHLSPQRGSPKRDQRHRND